MSMQYSLYRTVYLMLQREGTTATLTQLSPGTYDPATGTNTPDSSVVTTVQALFLDYSAMTGSETRPGTIIERGDKQCYLNAKSSAGVDLATKPSPAGDTITINGVVWRIIDAKEINPTQSYTIMWDLLLRK